MRTRPLDAKAAIVTGAGSRAEGIRVNRIAPDVAHAVLFLVSGEARYITGVVFPVDGRVTLASSPR